MPITGEIPRAGGGSDSFVLPDPKSGELTSGRLQIQPETWRRILWAPNHMPSQGKGAGIIYLKLDKVGPNISTVNLPAVGSTGTLVDSDTGTQIRVTRT